MLKNLKDVQWFERKHKIAFLKQSATFQRRVLKALNRLFYLYMKEDISRADMICEIQLVEDKFYKEIN